MSVQLKITFSSYLMLNVSLGRVIFSLGSHKALGLYIQTMALERVVGNSQGKQYPLSVHVGYILNI